MNQLRPAVFPNGEIYSPRVALNWARLATYLFQGGPLFNPSVHHWF